MNEDRGAERRGRDARRTGDWLAWALLITAAWLGGLWLLGLAPDRAAVKPWFTAWLAIGFCLHVWSWARADGQLGAEGLGFAVLLAGECGLGFYAAALIAHGHGMMELFP